MTEVSCEIFNPLHIAESGQTFRFAKKNGEYTFFSENHAAKIVKSDGKYVIISTNDEYFYNYFDLQRDYEKVNDRLQSYPQLSEAIEFGKGMRILRQDPFETLICFLISQNNHIARICGIVERLCQRLGERKKFENETYFAFPTAERMAEQTEEFYKEIGAGYRAPYLLKSAKLALETDFSELKKLPDDKLRERLMKFPGVGPKVRDCIVLFGFGREKAFPVDTWIEKVYLEYFDGKETDRVKMTAFFENLFGDDSGYAQQLLFYYARKNKIKIGG